VLLSGKSGGFNRWNAMAKIEEIIKKVNNGEIVKFPRQYWPNFQDYLNFYGIDLKCHMVIDGDYVLLGLEQKQGPKQIR
jgi:hypothetical protein